MSPEGRVKVGFFSFTGASPDGDDRPYLAWHQLDHMPEQYRLPGMVLGQRWRSTPACRRARAVEADGWSSVEHLVCYLMGEPVDRTVDDFLSLGRELAEIGRYPVAMPSHYRGALRLLSARAAPRVLVSDEVVPFRPHRGVFVAVEEARTEGAGGEGGPRDLGALPDELTTGLLDLPGVAGVWVYATASDLQRSMFTQGRLRITVCYLDDDPPAVGGRIASVAGSEWGGAPARVVLAAPFESIVTWEWDGSRTP